MNSIATWIAGIMPKSVVYHCAIRLIAFGTCGKYGTTEVSSLTAMDALARWEKQ